MTSTEGQDKTGRNGIWVHIEWKLQDLWLSGLCDSLSRRGEEQRAATLKAENNKSKGIMKHQGSDKQGWNWTVEKFSIFIFPPLQIREHQD